MRFAVGSTLGSYRIVAALGAGGMGEVYRAHDPRLGRDVAVKVLPDDLAAAPNRLARFEREARIVASLNHPAIVTLFSIEESAGTRFITMELVDGQTLADIMPPSGLTVTRVVELMLSLVGALGTAHAKGVVHRDLKPANVMVDRAGRVKVLDFGLAKLADSHSDSGPNSPSDTMAPLSMHGEVLGTAPYMAPEQIFGEAIDARTDLFALGIVSYEMLTGQRPFVGNSFWEIATAIMRDDPRALSDVRRDVPDDLERIVRRCLEKRPADRYQSTVELHDALHDVARALAYRAPEGEWRHGSMPQGSRAQRGVASVAILPFVNRSANQDDEYFADGLADELLGLLTKIEGLRVSARASSFQFKDRARPLAEIGRALGVSTLLDGSMRRHGNRVRISVQLVKVSDGYHLWSGSYDRTIDDIFEVQDDIAQAVVKELRTTLLGKRDDADASGRAKADVHQAAKGRSVNPEAHRLYLLARHAMDQYSRESTARAIDYLTQAVERDADFALAWAELSVAYSRNAGWGLLPLEEGFQRARDSVHRSLTLEPSLAEGHLQVTWISIFHDWDWRAAERSLARARTLAPGSAAVLRLSGVLAGVLGRPAEAIECCRRALELDPVSAAAYHSLGLALSVVEDVSGAHDAFRRALELAPQRIATRAHLSFALLALRRREEALAEATREPETGYRLCALGIVQHQLGNAVEADSALRQLIDGYADGWALQVAEVHAARGEIDEAFVWLERAHRKRDTGLAQAMQNPRLRGLRGDARWTALLRSLELVPA